MPASRQQKNFQTETFLIIQDLFKILRFFQSNLWTNTTKLRAEETYALFANDMIESASLNDNRKNVNKDNCQKREIIFKLEEITDRQNRRQKTQVQKVVLSNRQGWSTKQRLDKDLKSGGTRKIKIPENHQFSLFQESKPEGGLSLDLEPADKEPKNQNWLF